MTRPASPDSVARKRLVLEVVAGVRLSDREAQVLGLLREGLGTQVIAGRLGVSPITVRRHAASLQAKLGVRRRKEAVAAAQRLSAAPRGPAARRRLRLEEGRRRRIERLPEEALVDASLTRREGQVLALLQEGRDTAAIGEVLGISPVTVRRHTSGLLAKLGARDRP